MEKIVLPGTDLSVSRLSFGTARLHHLPGSNQRQSLLASAVEHGFSHLDTAPYYGFGLAETEIGRFLKSHRYELTIASKVGLHPPLGPASSTAGIWIRKGLGKIVPSLSRPVVDWSIAAATASLEATLRRLRREYVDILFLHEPAPELLHTEELLKWFEQQRTSGKVRYWGLAGAPARFETLIQQNHPLARILQVQDWLDTKISHPVIKHGRSFQFTYGYLAAAKEEHASPVIEDVIKIALSRNRTGSILLSTRRITHIPQLVSSQISI